MSGAPAGLAIHATAVAVTGRGLLIRGASGAGKSALALALLAAASPRQRIDLVGDDRVLLRRRGAGIVAFPHPRIAGFIERRGLGLVATGWVPRAPLVGVVALGALAHAGEAEAWLAALPLLALAAGGSGGGDADRVLLALQVLSWLDDRASMSAGAAGRTQVA